MLFPDRAKNCQLKTIKVHGYDAHLECPTTKETGDGKPLYAHVGGDWKSSEKRVIRKVQNMVGDAACKGCRFYGMSPAEVDELKGREASAKALRIFGENELMVAEVQREELLKTLGNTAAPEQIIPQIQPAAEIHALPPAVMPHTEPPALG